MGENEEYDGTAMKRRQFLGVLDNELNKIRNECLSIWFKHLPLKLDTVEGECCHSYVFKLLQNKNPIILGQNLSNLPFILKMFSKIAKTKLSSQQLDNVVSEFAKTICKSQPQFAQNLTMTEKSNL